MNVKQLLKVGVSMFKIGCIGFGGGSALIPIMEKEAVRDNDYLTEEEYVHCTVVSNITPGALPVKLGGLIGEKVAGSVGMLVGSLLTSLPGVLIMLALLSTIALLGEGVLEKIEFASVGIAVFIISLLVHYITKILNDSKKAKFTKGAYILMIGTMLLTFGKEIRHFLLELNIENNLTNSATMFDISTINVLVLVFFLIFFTCGQFKKGKAIIAGIITVIYVLSFGKSPIINLGEFALFFQIGMMVLALFTTIRDAKKESNVSAKIDFKTPTKQSIPFVILTALLFFACMFLTQTDPTYFFTNGLLSVVTSFGGGEAYLTVADGIFVAEGIVSSSDFYGQILPIANALPGSILVKILVGVGFVSASAESMFAAWLFSIFALVLSTTASCVVCAYVSTIYNTFSNLKIFVVLKVWILPVICGLLLSTIISMLSEAVKICAQANLGQIPTLGLIVVIYGFVIFLHKKFHLHDVFQIIIAALMSLIVLSVM